MAHGAFKDIQGKPLELAISALHDFNLDLHAVAFQEVGGVRHDLSDHEISVKAIDGLALLVAKPAGCFRPVAFGLDTDCLADWCNSHAVGHSHLCCTVVVPPFAKRVCLVSVHLPHQGRSMDDFLAALSSWNCACGRFSGTSIPIIVLGDLNVALCRGPGARFTALQASFCGLGLVHFF